MLLIEIPKICCSVAANEKWAYERTLAGYVTILSPLFRRIFVGYLTRV